MAAAWGGSRLWWQPQGGPWVAEGRASGSRGQRDARSDGVDPRCPAPCGQSELSAPASAVRGENVRFGEAGALGQFSRRGPPLPSVRTLTRLYVAVRRAAAASMAATRPSMPLEHQSLGWASTTRSPSLLLSSDAASTCGMRASAAVLISEGLHAATVLTAFLGFEGEQRIHIYTILTHLG